jgi:ATP-binding cassette subfamily B (MDR/TAP) protein 1
MSEKVDSKPEQQTKKVSILQLFRYANGLDYFLMFIGTLFAILNGATLPLMTIFFGDIINNLVTYYPALATPASTSAFDANIKDGVIKMCIVGAITFISSYIQMACWMLAGENQAKRIREKYFNSVVRQQVSWFDKVTTGELTNRMTSDMNK